MSRIAEGRKGKVYPVSLRDEIRNWVLVEGKSQRAAARHFDVSRNTVTKLLQEEPAAQERRYQRAKAVKYIEIFSSKYHAFRDPIYPILETNW
jgi:DNA invertase Pin-like site-specific DNA recombinase